MHQTMKHLATLLCLLSVVVGTVQQAQASDTPTKADTIHYNKFISSAEENMNHLAPNYYKAIEWLNEAYRVLPDHPKANYYLGVMYLNTYNKTRAIPHLRQVTKYNQHRYAEAWFMLGRAYQLTHQFDKATEAYKAYQEKLTVSDLQGREVLTAIAPIIDGKRRFDKTRTIIYYGLSQQVEKRLEECEWGVLFTETPDERVVVENLGPEINTKYPDYSPELPGDETAIYFTTRRKEVAGQPVYDPDGKYYEDIYVTRITEEGWSAPKRVEPNINTDDHNAIVGLSFSGESMFVYTPENNGDILVAHKDGKDWERPETLAFPVNSEATERSLTVAPSGDMIFLVRDVPVKGQRPHRDIFISRLDDSGNWTEPAPLPETINTPFDEDAPYMHPDGKTLYFSSTGHTTMGGYDVFKTTWDGQTWTPVENLGVPVNSAADDIFYKLAPSGRHAVFASSRPGGQGDMDLYQAKIDVVKDAPNMADAVTVLVGNVLDAKTQEPLQANVNVFDLATNELVTEFTTNSATGKYLLALPTGKNYAFVVAKEDYLFHSDNFDVPEDSEYEQVHRDILLYPIESGSVVELRNIFFHFDEAKLLTQSENELDRVVRFMMRNPDVEIEIGGHTDSKGTEAYNLELSQQRAEVVVDCLVNQGIERSRLSAKGYGESEPLADNTTENNEDNPVGRMKNRRTELSIK